MRKLITLVGFALLVSTVVFTVDDLDIQFESQTCRSYSRKRATRHHSRKEQVCRRVLRVKRVRGQNCNRPRLAGSTGLLWASRCLYWPWSRLASP